jgi:hypothetical protein
MRHQAGPYRIWILAFLLIIIVAEILWSWKNDKKAYEIKETFSNLAVFAGFQFSKVLFAGYQLAALGFFSGIALFHLPHNPWIFLLTFITGSTGLRISAPRFGLFTRYIIRQAT